jgi:plasmid stabilization system protein ParE
MAAEVRWTKRSRRQFNQVLSYLARREPDAVGTVSDAITSQVERLADHAYLGSVFRRTRRGEVRETLAVNYRIFFRVERKGAVVRVLCLCHARRQDPDFWG